MTSDTASTSSVYIMLNDHFTVPNPLSEFSPRTLESPETPKSILLGPFLNAHYSEVALTGISDIPTFVLNTQSTTPRDQNLYNRANTMSTIKIPDYMKRSALQPRRLRVVGIGAGASGLLLAYKIQRNFCNVDLTIFEKNDGQYWKRKDKSLLNRRQA